jgi:GT2 family glycosyltransferase
MEASSVEPLGPRASEVDGEEGAAEREGTDISITVVVTTFNSADHIDDCLGSIARHLPSAQSVVVDNGSTDGTQERVRERFPDALVLAGHGNVGFGAACNLGAQQASGDYLLFLNPDAELMTADGEALREESRAPSFGMLASSLLEGGSTTPLLRRHSGRWPAELLGAHLLAILSPLAPRPRHMERHTGRGLCTVSGAAFMVRAWEFRALGGFDERFFMYYEDTDLTQRYLRQGYPLRASRAIAIRHVGGTSAPVPRRNALSFLGWLEYLAKWHGPGAARRAAAAAKLAYALVLALLRLLAPLAGGRVRAKAEELAAMLSHIANAGVEMAPSAMAPHEAVAGSRYPAAMPIATRSFRAYRSGARP